MSDDKFEMNNNIDETGPLNPSEAVNPAPTVETSSEALNPAPMADAPADTPSDAPRPKRRAASSATSSSSASAGSETKSGRNSSTKSGTKSGKKGKNGKKGKKKKKKKMRLADKILIVIFIIGFMILNYPSFSNIYNQYRQSLLISDYHATIRNIPDTEVKKIWQRAEGYNERVAKQGQLVYKDLMSAEDVAEETDYESYLNVSGDGTMGSIEIPKINVYLGINHGLSEEVLKKGVGHMVGSSLPVGGETSHCILAGHRGLPSAELFTDLDQLDKGDEIYLHILNRTLKYLVDDIKVVLPDQIDQIELVPGEDYITLITCTPYGVNSHRMLVRGTRVDYDDSEDVMESTPVKSMLSWTLDQRLLILSFVVLVVLITAMVKSSKDAKPKKKGKKKGKNSKNKKSKKKRDDSQ